MGRPADAAGLPTCFCVELLRGGDLRPPGGGRGRGSRSDEQVCPEVILAVRHRDGRIDAARITDSTGERHEDACADRRVELWNRAIGSETRDHEVIGARAGVRDHRKWSLCKREGTVGADESASYERGACRTPSPRSPRSARWNRPRSPRSVPSPRLLLLPRSVPSRQ